MTLLEIQGALRGAGLKDVIVAGFIDKDERPVRFCALWRTVYFECDDVLLKATVIGDSGRMRLAVVDTVCCDANLDDDMLPASSSVSLQLLRDPDGSNLIAAIRLWNPDESSGDIQCAAARIDLVNGQRIFVDPSYHFGIRIGGREQEEEWAENRIEPTQEQVEIVLSPPSSGSPTP